MSIIRPLSYTSLRIGVRLLVLTSSVRSQVVVYGDGYASSLVVSDDDDDSVMNVAVKSIVVKVFVGNIG